jgi:hypothetical protein
MFLAIVLGLSLFSLMLRSDPYESHIGLPPSLLITDRPLPSNASSHTTKDIFGDSIRLIVCEKHLNDGGSAHGGLLASLADYAVCGTAYGHLLRTYADHSYGKRE